jgi:hypothetical protein
LGQSPLHSTGAKLQQLLDLKVQQWQQQKGQLQQVPEAREDESGKPNVTAAAAAAAGAEGVNMCQLLCDAPGKIVEGLQAVADGQLMQRDW